MQFKSYKDIVFRGLSEDYYLDAARTTGYHWTNPEQLILKLSKVYNISLLPLDICSIPGIKYLDG